MQAWKAFLSQLDQELGTHVVDKWVRPFIVLRFDAANLYLQAENSFQATWFEEHIRPRLKKNFLNNNLRPIAVHIQVGNSPPSSLAAASPKPPSPYEIKPDPLERDFTFEHFFSSEKNAVPCRLLQELDSLSLPLGTFNPIFLYGPKSSGKTHLLTAIAHALGQQKKVFFVNAETFTEHVVQAIRFASMSSFRQTYREIDLFIVDDIHKLAKKAATQEEFFHTFNALHTLGRQIILSANAPPSQLADIEARLISRFEWGLSTSIEPSSHLQQILERKAMLWRLSVRPEVFSFLMQELPSNPIKALQVLALRANQTAVDLKLAQKLLQDFLDQEKKERLTPEQLIKQIAAHFGIKAEDLLSKSQTREHSFPRQIAMHMCRHQLHMPFQAIGALFRRDHSTVMANVKQIEQGIQEKKQDLIQIIRSCSTEKIKS